MEFSRQKIRMEFQHKRDETHHFLPENYFKVAFVFGQKQPIKSLIVLLIRKLKQNCQMQKCMLKEEEFELIRTNPIFRT